MRPLRSVDVFYGLCYVRVKAVDLLRANILCPEDWHVIKFQWSINKDLFFVTQVFSLSLSLSLPLSNYLLEWSRLFSACRPWSRLLTSEQGSREPVLTFRLTEAGPVLYESGCIWSTWQKGVRERENAGEWIFFLSTSVCVYYALIWWNLIPAMQPTVPSAGAAPFGLLSRLS